MTAAENGPQLPFRFETILNVPHARKELSWQRGLGETGNASGRFSPAASLDDHCEQPEESVLVAGRLPMKLVGRGRDHSYHLPG
jgi:hypothetical protein